MKSRLQFRTEVYNFGSMWSVPLWSRVNETGCGEFWLVALVVYGLSICHLKYIFFLISNAVFSHKTLHNSCQLLLTFYTSFMAYLMQQLFLGSTLYSFSVGEWILISYRFWVGKANNLAGFPVLWNFISTDGRFWPLFFLRKCSSGKFS